MEKLASLAATEVTDAGGPAGRLLPWRRGGTERLPRVSADVDGTFVFHNVIPGSYTAVAIENGWDLDWGQPELISRYAKQGVPVQVGDKSGQSLKLNGPLEVQQK